MRGVMLLTSLTITNRIDQALTEDGKLLLDQDSKVGVDCHVAERSAHAPICW
jgi:hypothetical protein